MSVSVLSLVSQRGRMEWELEDLRTFIFNDPDLLTQELHFNKQNTRKKRENVCEWRLC